MKKAKVIGICGVSCSGKTTLAKSLEQKLKRDIKLLRFDKYYISSEEIADKAISWESPDHYRYDQFVQDLRILKNKTEELILVEGFIIFYDENARKLYDKKIYLDLPEDVIITRRLNRNRGTESDTPEYINKELLAGHRKYVYRQKKHADLVLDATKSIEELERKIIGVIKETK